MKKIIGISYILILLLSLTACISSTERKNGKEDVRVGKKLIYKNNLALSTKAWLDRVNPIIRGKVNYYLNLHKAIKANEEHGQISRCIVNATGQLLHKIDEYTRQRLRVAMVHGN